MTTPKKRNPNDSTFRNITALKKRVSLLESYVANGSTLRDLVQRLMQRIEKVEARFEMSDYMATRKSPKALKRVYKKGKK